MSNRKGLWDRLIIKDKEENNVIYEKIRSR